MIIIRSAILSAFWILASFLKQNKKNESIRSSDALSAVKGIGLTETMDWNLLFTYIIVLTM